MDANESGGPGASPGGGSNAESALPPNELFPVPAPRPVSPFPISPPTASSSASASAGTVTATESTAGGSFFPGAGDVDGELASAEILAVKLFDGLLRLLGCAELDERKTAGAAGLAIQHDVDAGDHPGGAEVILKFPIPDLIGEVAHEQPAIAFHNTADTTASYVYRPAATRSQGSGRGNPSSGLSG